MIILRDINLLFLLFLVSGFIIAYFFKRGMLYILLGILIFDLISGLGIWNLISYFCNIHQLIMSPHQYGYALETLFKKILESPLSLLMLMLGSGAVFGHLLKKRNLVNSIPRN